MPGSPAGNSKQNALQGYPSYASNEDIYNKYHEERDIDPGDISKSKDLNTIDKTESIKKNGFPGEISGRDLDVPGSELDDEMENNGDEDEENNYYSIGGDGHENLDEDKGGE